MGSGDPVGCNSQTSSGTSHTIFGGRAEDPAPRTRVFNAYPKTPPERMTHDTKTLSKQPPNFPHSPQNHPAEGFRWGLGVFEGFGVGLGVFGTPWVAIARPLPARATPSSAAKLRTPHFAFVSLMHTPKPSRTYETRHQNHFKTTHKLPKSSPEPPHVRVSRGFGCV